MQKTAPRSHYWFPYNSFSKNSIKNEATRWKTPLILLVCMRSHYLWCHFDEAFKVRSLGFRSLVCLMPQSTAILRATYSFFYSGPLYYTRKNTPENPNIIVLNEGMKERLYSILHYKGRNTAIANECQVCCPSEARAAVTRVAFAVFCFE